jgi:hypothetical protein
MLFLLPVCLAGYGLNIMVVTIQVLYAHILATKSQSQQVSQRNKAFISVSFGLRILVALF